VALIKKDKGYRLCAHSLRDHIFHLGECPLQRPIWIPLPSHDPFLSIHEKGGKAPDAVSQDLPHATQGLGIHEPDDNPLAIFLASLADPL